MSIPMIVIILIGTFGFMFYMKRRLNTQYAHMRAGQAAQRLQMRIVEGDPEHNLVTQSVLPSVRNAGSARGFLTQMAATQVGGTLGEFKLRMLGEPYGAQVELVLYVREDFKPGFTENVTTTWSDCRLTVHARTAVVPFDLRLRKEHMGLETRQSCEEQHMPQQGFGDVALDQRFVLETFDPALPRRIAAALGPILHVIPYVHVVGSGNQVSFKMTPQAVAASASCFEQVL